LGRVGRSAAGASPNATASRLWTLRCDQSHMTTREGHVRAEGGPYSARLPRPTAEGVRRRPRGASADDLPILGPAHARATLVPTLPSSHNAPMPATDRSTAPYSALSARAHSQADKAVSESAIIEHGRLLEEQARERLARVKAKLLREETRRSSAAAIQHARDERAKRAAHVKSDLERRQGRDVLQELAAVPKASAAEVQELSDLFNEKVRSRPAVRPRASAARPPPRARGAGRLARALAERRAAGSPTFCARVRVAVILGMRCWRVAYAAG
jgi:hypothetical protein